MVSLRHCLNDLLYRYRTADLQIEFRDHLEPHHFAGLAASYDIPFTTFR